MSEGAYKIKYIRRIDLSDVHPQLANAKLQLMSDFQVDCMVSKVRLCKRIKRFN